MEILKTPWKTTLLDLVHESKDAIKITCPYIKKDICSEVLAIKVPKTKFELITSFKLKNIYSGFLDLEALHTILDKNGIVKNHSGLHSKIYLFDDKKAVVTSSNLTSSGLLSNYEYGIFLDEKNIVSLIADDFNELSRDVDTGTIKKSDLVTAREILEKVAKAPAVKLPGFPFTGEGEVSDVLATHVDPIRQSIAGWTRDVFDIVAMISKDRFSLAEAYQFETALQEMHPNNRFVQAKIRQQLQVLRDLGLIEFRGGGHYRKLWRPPSL